MSPGFGRGPFGSGGFGEWPWSRFAFVEGVPEVYREQDEIEADGALRAFMESVAPSLDDIRRKIRDFDVLRDPLRCPAESEFLRSVSIVETRDLGDGTSRVFIGINSEGDAVDGVRPGMSLLDLRGIRFRVVRVNESASPKDFDDPPIDPTTSEAVGRNVVVENISASSTEIVPFVSGEIIEDEDVSPSPVDDGSNEGPYSFTLSESPVSRNRVVVNWLEGGEPAEGFFSNTGGTGGQLRSVSSIDFDTGDVVMYNATGEPVDADSIRVTYVKHIPGNEDAEFRAQNILGFLGSDYGAMMDRNDPEHLQRSYVYHSYQLWDEKGSESSYENIGRLAGYRVNATPLHKIDSAWREALPEQSLFEIPLGSGSYFTSIEPRRDLMDEVSLDSSPLDLICSEDEYPSIVQYVTIDDVSVDHRRGTRSAYLLTVSTSQMHKSLGTHGDIVDGNGSEFSIDEYKRLGESSFLITVISVSEPSPGQGTIEWRAKTAGSPFTINLSDHVEDLGRNSLYASGRRYRITGEFTNPPVADVGNWVLIDSKGITYYLESFEGRGGDEYRFEIISDDPPPEGLANIFYKCPIVTDCTYCRASSVVIRITADEILDYPDAMGGDALGRLIGRIRQIIPIHVRTPIFLYDPGPSIAEMNITASSTSSEESDALDTYSATYDADFSAVWYTDNHLTDHEFDDEWMGHNKAKVDMMPIAASSKITVEVNADPPSVSFSSSINSMTVSLSGSATTDGDVPVYRWAWDFGDGFTSVGQNTSHTYAEPGTYRVTLFATDSHGLTGQHSENVTVP